MTHVQVRTDDDIYRVDSVWLGPPRATFPWRVRYVGYGVGLAMMILVLFVQRRVGIGLDFFSVAWALVITVVTTRFLGSRIDYERPLGQVLGMLGREVTGPRRRTDVAGGAVRTRHVRVASGVTARTTRPRANPRRQARVDPREQTRADAWTRSRDGASQAAAGGRAGKGRGRRATA